MPENFIVTITNAQGTFEIDLQIPARLRMSELAGKLLEILKMLDNREFRHWSKFQMSVADRVLLGSDTFASAGVFDGSRIVVSEA